MQQRTRWHRETGLITSITVEYLVPKQQALLAKQQGSDNAYHENVSSNDLVGCSCDYYTDG